jgi:serine protease Do
MKKSVLSAAAFTAFSVMVAGTSMAQVAEQGKAAEPAKPAREAKKAKSKLGDYEEIIIKKKTDADTKVTVEIKDGEVSIDGKPIDDYESEALSVRRRKPAVISYGTPRSPFTDGEVIVNGYRSGLSTASANRGFLGVATQETDKGVSISQVNKGSAAEKAGLKTGDIITKIDDSNIEDPGDVSDAIRKHKPEDKVTITYKRDGKESKVTATLGKNTGNAIAYGDLNNVIAPRLNGLRSLENFNWDSNGQNFVFGRGRIGIRAQDTEESNGAKVLDVADESAAAKAGILKDDIITSFDGKKITNADELSAAARDAREKSSMEVKLNRSGKSQTVEIKIPKKLKTTNL